MINIINMAWIAASIILILILLASLILHTWLFKLKARKLPPGPKGLPIIGSLHLLTNLPHRDLHHLSQSYGSIMHIKLGLKSAIIVSSPHAAELFLKTHDPIFADRPAAQTSNHMSYGQKDMASANYGPYWRNMRKLCTFKFLTTLKINSFRSIRKKELCFFIDRLREAANRHVVVDLSSELSSLIADMICEMMFGKKFIGEDFKAAIHEATWLMGASNLGDFIPFISLLDLQGFGRRAKAVSKVFDGYLDMIIEQRLESSKDENETKGLFVDIMLDLIGSREMEHQIDRSNVKGLIIDLIIGAVDTSSTIISWALSELIKHQHVMKKMQDELKEVVGLDRMVEESDISQLKYLDMVIKENFRMHPPVPLVPRASAEDCNVNGYHIPKKSYILINEWAIGRDPHTWFDPHKFFPERFVDIQVDVRGSDFRLIPFGSSRRICPGMQLGLILVQLILAQLVHCFDWELPNAMLPTELDMTEEFGLICPKAQNLSAIPIYRIGIK